MGAQHPLVVEFTLVIHVVLKLPQGLRRFKQLPVLVVWEVVLDEQGGMGQEVEFIVARAEEELVSSAWGEQGQPCGGGGGASRGDLWLLLLANAPTGGVPPMP